jgi:hypothetical protein
LAALGNGISQALGTNGVGAALGSGLSGLLGMGGNYTGPTGTTAGQFDYGSLGSGIGTTGYSPDMNLNLPSTNYADLYSATNFDPSDSSTWY